MKNEITLRQPDDWHLHLRDGAMLETVVSYTARTFGRALVMPNLTPPVTDQSKALAYRSRICQAAGPASTFSPKMAIYLTPKTDAQIVKDISDNDDLLVLKYYPSGATTNSEFGVTDIRMCYPVLEEAQALGVPMAIHGEVTDPSVDIFDREAVFVNTTLKQIVKDFPKLKVILEHISTTEGAEFVEKGSDYLAGTITPHHLAINRSDLLAGGIKPHYYCLPIVKHQKHQCYLRYLITKGNPKFFAGTDSAPHPVSSKMREKAAAGIFCAPAAISIYAQIFEEMNCLDHLENFASVYGAEFYQLPLNEKYIQLEKHEWTIDETIGNGDQTVVPMFAGQTLPWRQVLD